MTAESSGRGSPELRDKLRINQACERFEAALKAGELPRIDEYLKGWQEPLRAELLAELLPLEQEYRQAEDQRQQDDQRGPRDPPLPTEGHGLHIRCPHCHQPIELVDDDPAGDVTCSSCGSRFNLVDDAGLTYTSPTLANIAHFETIEQIGIGAFGTVWKARDTQLDRTVAIKIPRKGQLTPEETSQFLREARAAAQLRHPNIVTVHEVGRQDDTVYIVSDYVRGISLADWLSGQRPTSREAAELCMKIAAALHHAHESGVIHRDLKPANIMIDADGEPHIMDFGLAKREAGEVTVTVDGAMLGTPAYMSPEQARGEGHQADRRTDVYSLGVMLFELLSGELPFRGNRNMLIFQVLHEPAPSPRKLDSHIPRDLETICLKCLEKQPEQRYASAQHLADELGRFLQSKPIHARPIRRPARAWRWCKRNPLVASLSAAVLLSLVIGTVVASVFSVKADEKAVEAIAEKKRADEERDIARAERKRAFRSYYASQMNLAQHDWETANIGMLVDRLERTKPEQTGGEDLRGFEWHYLRRLCNLQLLTLGCLDTYRFMNNVAFSRDGRRVATASSDSVLIWDVSSGRETLKIEIESEHESFHCADFTPDGKHIITGGLLWKATGKLGFELPGTVKLWSAETGKLIQSFEGHKHGVSALCVSHDGKRIASLGLSRIDPPGFGGEVKIWDTATAAEIASLSLQQEGHMITSIAFSPNGDRIVTGSARGIATWDAATGERKQNWNQQNSTGCVAFSPDGESIASGSYDRTVKVWNSRTGQLRRTLWGRTGTINSVAFSSDGRRIVSGSDDGTVNVWDASSGEETLTLKGHTSAVKSVAFSPDGWRIASLSRSGVVKIWDAVNSREFVRLRGHAAPLTAVVFSPDAKRIASAGLDRTIRVWDVNTKRLLRTLRGHKAGVISVAFDSDGDRIASVGDGGEVRLWNARTGQELFSLEGHEGRVSCVAFSPDDRQVATAGEDQVVRIWDVRSEKQILGLEGHTASVHGVAFSPDGRRVASASWDDTVRVWDLETGKQLLRYEGHTASVNNVSFINNGKMIISASHDRTVKIWDSNTGDDVRTLSGETGGIRGLAISADEQRAVTAGDSIIVWDLQTGQQLLTLRGSAGDWGSLSLSADGLCLAFATNSGKSSQDVVIWEASAMTPDGTAQLDATSLVEVLYAKETTKERVLAKLRQDLTISDSVRKRAITIANDWQQYFNARDLNRKSWDTVRHPNQDQARYKEALRSAKIACQLVPESLYYLNTLGVAQYRVGEYANALATFTQSLELNRELDRVQDDIALPANFAFRLPFDPYKLVQTTDVAFLAMAQHKLGQTAEAKARLAELRKLMKDRRFLKNNAELQGFLKEAEALIEGGP